MFFVDNAQRPDSSNVGRDWEDESGAWSISGNGIYSPATGDYQSNQLIRPLPEAFADGIVQVDYHHIVDFTGVPQVQGRVQGVNNDTFYVCYVSYTSFVLAKSVGGVLTTLASGVIPFDNAGGYRYRIKLILDGTTISAYHWFTVTPINAPELRSFLSVVDSSITGSGRHGLSIGSTGGSGDNVKYGNYVAVNDIVFHGWSRRIYDGIATLGGWTVTAGVIVDVRDNDEKMVLSDSGAGVETADQAFDEPGAPYIFEADVKSASGQKGYMQLLNAADAVIASVTINSPSDGTFEFDTNNAALTSAAWPVNEYKQIKLLVDPAGKTVRCQYSTGSGTKPSSWLWVSAAKSYTGTIAKVRFGTNAADTGEVVVDNIRLYIPSFGAIGGSNIAGYGPAGTSQWNVNPQSPEKRSVTEEEGHNVPIQVNGIFPFGYSRTNFYCIDFGINNNQLDDMDIEVQNLLDLGIRHIILMGGSSDVANGRTLVQMKASVNSIFGKINAAGISATVCTIPPNNTFNTAQNTLKSDFNSWLVGESMLNDFYSAFVHDGVQGTTDNIDVLYDSGDGIHLNTTGLNEVASIIGRSEYGVVSLSGTVRDKNGNIIDGSTYPVEIVIYLSSTLVVVGLLTTTDPLGKWSHSSGMLASTNYTVAFFYIGNYPPTGDVDIAGSEIMQASF